MNQYEQFITDFLLKNKFLSLEKIGSFSAESTSPDGNAKIHFDFNRRAETSEEFVDYVASAKAKSRMVVAADVSSHLESVVQLLNIRKSYELGSLGFLKVEQDGSYTFEVASPSEKKEEHRNRNPKASTDYTGNYTTPAKPSNRSALMAVALIVVCAILGVIGWGAYKLFIENKEKTELNTAGNASTTPQDSSATMPADSASTSLNNTQGAVDTVSTTASADSATYKFIHEYTYSLARAKSRTDSLSKWGSPAFMDSIKTDSAEMYQLYLKLKVAKNDTARIKDSLAVYLGRKIAIKPLQQ